MTIKYMLYDKQRENYLTDTLFNNFRSDLETGMLFDLLESANRISKSLGIKSDRFEIVEVKLDCYTTLVIKRIEIL